jgi:hypothetical protein
MSGIRKELAAGVGTFPAGPVLSGPLEVWARVGVGERFQFPRRD